MESIIVQLINELAKMGIVSKYDIIQQIGPEEVYVCRRHRRYDYFKIAEILRERPVFVPIDRKRSHYAQKRLSHILGRQVKKKRAIMNYTKGYLFYI